MIVLKNQIISILEIKNFVFFQVEIATMAALTKFMVKKKLESKNVHGTAIIAKRGILVIRIAKILIFIDIEKIYFFLY